MHKIIVSNKDYEKLKEVYEYMNLVYKAFENNDIDEKMMFDEIFSDKVSGFIYKTICSFCPYIPDTSYEEDASAFITAFKELFEEKLLVL